MNERARTFTSPISWPAAATAAITAAFIATTLWWVIRDGRVPDFDSGRHIVVAFRFHEALARGELLTPLTTFTLYPPLVHFVGAIGAFASTHVDAFVVIQNLVFVPLLVAGCYGTALVFSRTPVAALLAAVFALGTPLVASQFHAFMLDAPQAALIAVTVWLVLATDRFASAKLSFLAGIAAGLAMLVKQTSILFGLGLVATVFARGGWRNGRGLLAFAGAAALVAAPWYAHHAGDLRPYAEGAITHPGPGGFEDAPGALYPPRWSTKNAGWYFWNLVNNQLLLPLTLLFLVGTGFAAVRYLRRRAKDDLSPELIVGGLVSYLALTFAVSLHDPRYTLPATVYIAALATGWLAHVGRAVQIPAAALLVSIALINFAGVSFGLGKAERLTLPGAPESSLHERQFTLYSPEGFVRGGPSRGGDILAIMRAAHRDGVRVMEFDPTAVTLDFNGAGLEALALSVGITRPARYDPVSLTLDDAFLLRRVVTPSDPRPCATLDDGTGVYLVRGNPLIPFESYRLYCPTRVPKYYGPNA